MAITVEIFSDTVGEMVLAFSDLKSTGYIAQKKKKGTESFSTLGGKGVITWRNSALQQGKNGTCVQRGAGLPGNASDLHLD